METAANSLPPVVLSASRFALVKVSCAPTALPREPRDRLGICWSCQPAPSIFISGSDSFLGWIALGAHPDSTLTARGVGAFHREGKAASEGVARGASSSEQAWEPV